MEHKDRKRKTWDAGRPLSIGFLSVGLLFGIFGYWSIKTEIAGAVVGTGAIEVSTSMTAVQHPIGGVVDAVYVENGDVVAAGEIVVRLDPFQLQSDLKVVEGDLFETLANIARLEAVTEDRRDMILHPVLMEAAVGRQDLTSLIARQKAQLDAHFANLATESSLLDEQVMQIKAQIAGVEAQVAAVTDENVFVAEELTKARELSTKGLIKLSEMYKLEKDTVIIRGELGRFAAQVAELRGKITELELKRHALVPDARELAVTELSKLRPERTRHLEKRMSLLDSLSKLEIRAPVSGKVHESKVFGLRSVVVAASPLMMIVPSTEPVVVNVKIFATDIDQIYVGQDASLKFKAFNGREMPVILGSVARIGADAIADPTTKKFFYEVKVTLRDEELTKLGERALIPGMPVEAFLSTESRTPLNYVLRPIMTYFDRAFRDA
jgi:HlyD family secretion protein